MFRFRYATVAPFTDQRKTLCETEIGGFVIPAGTEVWINLWGIAHDESLWDEPMKFKSESEYNYH